MEVNKIFFEDEVKKMGAEMGKITSQSNSWWKMEISQ
jgi:hypothetical protein